MTTQNTDLTTIEEISPEEAAMVFGGAKKKKKVRYRVEVRNIKGKLRKVKRVISKKSVIKLKRQKKGVYSIRYRANSRNAKQTVSNGGDYSSAGSFNV